MTATFGAAQVEALKTLQQIWSKQQIVLIGASALGCFLDMRWRQTYDLDLSVSISVEEYASDLKKLRDWIHDSHFEPRWIAPGGARIDIIPAGFGLLAAGEIVWPQSGIRMSLIGLRLAFENNEKLQLAENLEFRIATMPVIAVLKMIAYQEKATERQRDLSDLAYILEEFLTDDDPRRFDDEVFQLGLGYEETSAFFLGKEIGHIVNEAELAKVNSFLAILRDESHPTLAQSKMLISAPASWQKDQRILLRILDVFVQGLRIGGTGRKLR
ncbi:MAG: nucleotidyl transferase AbiEii/AbiGii toxin family protein [Acidobacteriota bacterium]|jgi:predicted nucleotidyltransferase